MRSLTGLFLDAFILGFVPWSTPKDELPKAYLAQSDLLDSAPDLTEHVPDLEHYTSGPRGDMFRRTIWIGPEGSWTPFHKDPYIGIYNQSEPIQTLHHLPIPRHPSEVLNASSTGNQKIPPPTTRGRTATLPLFISAVQEYLNHPHLRQRLGFVAEFHSNRSPRRPAAGITGSEQTGARRGRSARGQL